MKTPEQILTALRRDSRNHITESWRFMNDVSGVASGSGLYNIAVNLFEPYYAGWCPALEFTEIFIPPSLLEQVRGNLCWESWGNENTGGKTYRLNNELRSAA